jgi:hypothetical protein
LLTNGFDTSQLSGEPAFVPKTQGERACRRPR